MCPACGADPVTDANYCSVCGQRLPGGERHPRNRVVVTGMGAVSPLGLTAQQTWNGLISGRSGICRIQRFDPSEIAVQIAGEVRNFDVSDWVSSKTARQMGMFSQYAVASAGMALNDACIDSSEFEPNRAGVVVGTGAGGMATILDTYDLSQRRGLMRISPHFMTMFPHNLPAYHLAQEFRFLGPSLTVSTACATGAQAIGEAAQFIRDGHADIALAGGTEHCVFPLFVASFAVQRAASSRNEDPAAASRPFDADRHGFVLGEGSAIFVLESLEHAQARGARIYAELLGYGSSDDGYHPIAPEPDGAGSSRAMRLAMSDGQVDPGRVGYINAHAASTPLGDKAETLAIKHALGEYAMDIPVSSSKSMIGHLMGAAGAVEALATVMSIYEGRVHPTINYDTPDPECDLDYVPNTARDVEIDVALSNSIGLGGQNACLAFGRYREDASSQD